MVEKCGKHMSQRGDYATELKAVEQRMSTQTLQVCDAAGDWKAQCGWPLGSMHCFLYQCSQFEINQSANQNNGN